MLFSQLQIFGSRIFPITKISDLLTGQGPPFDIALANHLYAPVSVYNTKFQKLTTPNDVSTANPTKFDFRHFQPQNPKAVGAPYYVEEIRPKKTLSRTPNFHLPGILGSEFYTQDSQYKQLRPKPVTSTPEPLLNVYKEQFNFGPFIPIAYNQQQPPVKVKPEELGFDYENQEGSREDKEQGLDKATTTYRNEKPNNPYIDAKTYHAHPDGAISYTRFIHNQAILDAQPDSQILYNIPPKTQQQTFGPELGQRENINVPEPPSSKPSNGIAPQQYVPVSQTLRQFHQPLIKPAPFQSRFHLENLSGSQFAIPQSPRRPVYYLHPIGNSLSEIRPSLASESLDQATNNSVAGDTFVPSAQQTLEPTQTRFTAQPNSQDSLPVLRHYTPLPAAITYYQSVAPLSKDPVTLQPQIQNTPKSPPSSDQVLQSTTRQPETISDTPRDVNAEPKYKSQESTSLTSPTLQSFLESPATLLSISSPQPTKHYLPSTPRTEILTSAQQTHVQATPHDQVQIQQQNLQEIHSELAPERQDNAQHLKKLTQEDHQSLPPTPEYVPTTPLPTEKSSPDYEIEIASHIDHNQLPKDLQPVTTAQPTNDLVENRGQQVQQFYSPNNTYILARRPYIVPIQSFGEPPSYQNINYHDPNSLFLGQSLATTQPFIQPGAFSNVQELVLQPHFQQTSSFPPVQYYGKYAQSIFGGV
ncbi:unnamed protein product [Arctia plantaginis]|uniref:Uncharacterized protein n=1 Tax=Arctia plantaginis TaxID=874455 RepID=A0A8S0Z5W5_ARCPL|nr:unnamed protein product [Arctia plantaginis]CAB3228199.1 unnamed protein product [Arctia plantaginis]